jgi:hypothetical protein
MKKKIFYLIFLFIGISVIDSCTKLKEQVLDESSLPVLPNSRSLKEILRLCMRFFLHCFNIPTCLQLQEISTDEAILPYRGGTDWGDNGIYLSLHRHETLSSDPNVNNTWSQIVQSISRTVTAINALATK